MADSQTKPIFTNRFNSHEEMIEFYAPRKIECSEKGEHINGKPINVHGDLTTWYCDYCDENYSKPFDFSSNLEHYLKHSTDRPSQRFLQSVEFNV
jgi:hypothetical protein